MLSTPRRLAAAPLAVLGLAVFTSSAAANIPAPITESNTVHSPAPSNLARGTMTTEVTYTDTTATARAFTSAAISLPPGFSYRLRTCVAYHLNATPPVSSCAERTADTRAETAPILRRAPTVTLAAQPRPTTQPWGYFTPYVEVLSLNASVWTVSAHSWSDEGLQGAGIAVAAQEQITGTLPANSTVTFDSPFNSAINSGQPDSICSDQPAPSNGSPLPAGVSTSHPAFDGAPAYYEVGLPTGSHTGQAPLGIMLVIHGGGWTITSVGAVQAMRPEADRWRARGWETVNLSYRACGQSAADVLWFYDRARAGFDPSARLCTLGLSAGGHLALLVAAQRSGVYCAISEAGPTDLNRIQGEVAYDAASGTYSQTVGGRWVHNLAAAAFGEENLAAYSPAAQASPALTSTRVLQGFSLDDALVPYRQAIDLAAAMSAADPAAYVDSVLLEIGTIPFGHGRVTRRALDDFYARERLLVAPAAP
jgi:acetyl esterase/lipase